MEYVEWRVPNAALEWSYRTTGTKEVQRAFSLLLRLFLPVISLVATILYFVLPERLNAEFMLVLTLLYAGMGGTICALPALTLLEQRRKGVWYRLDDAGLERRGISKPRRISWAELRQHGVTGWRIVPHPGVQGLKAVELLAREPGIYLPFDPAELDENRLRILLSRYPGIFEG